MCGRFTLTADRESLQAAFPQIVWPVRHAPRYNIAPGQPVLAVPNDGRRRADFFLWGLIPPWAKDPKIGYRLINARAETLKEKPSFRGAYRYRRCLIPADGFYEWQGPKSRRKQPWYIHRRDHQPFALGGLWETWQAADGSTVRTCTIITTQAAPDLQAIHGRMPLILPRETWDLWLTPDDRATARLDTLLRPAETTDLEAWPVSTLVNRPENDIPDCIAPLPRP